MATSIRIRGLVQGVGFRPFVWHLATDLGITGQVWNDAEGVLIHAWADSATLDSFCNQITEKAPPLARIDSLECSTLKAATATTFTIESSRENSKTTAAITPDATLCPACRAETADPNDRHFNYPFTSCTYCGPRLSIVRALPYDRANTSMAPFQMCGLCQAEYDDPSNRRFHAQTNACPECGPHIWLEDASGNRSNISSSSQLITETTELLREGHIVAIKGIGGVHLAVDAGNNQAVSRLRERKQRYDKPFALMAKDIESISRYAKVNEQEQQLLNSTAAPIVLLERIADSEQLSGSIAPRQSRLGFMLPYSPLHSLLMSQIDRPIVLTSGNSSDEPQCINNDDARKLLSDIADYFLLNDRDIVNRLDDSVAMIMAGQKRLLRRARGYTPSPIMLHKSFASCPDILAMGGELKNTFCQLSNAQAVISQHIGDLENASSHADYRNALKLYAQMYDFYPQAIVIDQHPDYFSSQQGQEMAQSTDLPLLAFQHHHAHIAAVLAEHRMAMDTKPVLGIALDGLGLGEDGTLWGGEFLLADYRQFRRIGCFQPVAMPGAAQAVREPWRNSFAHLKSSGWDEIESIFSDNDIIRFLSNKPLHILHSMIEKELNSPLSSSCGRLFDAAAAMLGICMESTGYEGQAAIELECLAQTAFATELQHYPYHLNSTEELNIINWKCMWPALLNDLNQGTDRGLIAARFHRTVTTAVANLAQQLCHQHELKTVVLCGGAFQNQLLLDTISADLMNHELKVLIIEQVPMNDGGLALGQAAIAAATLMQESQHD